MNTQSTETQSSSRKHTHTPSNLLCTLGSVLGHSPHVPNISNNALLVATTGQTPEACENEVRGNHLKQCRQQLQRLIWPLSSRSIKMSKTSDPIILLKGIYYKKKKKKKGKEKPKFLNKKVLGIIKNFFFFFWSF